MSSARDQVLIDSFATVVREIRAREGFSQEQLAAAVGVDRTYIGMLEAGKRQPTLSVICALETAFKLSPGVLVKRAYKLYKPTNAHEKRV